MARKIRKEIHGYVYVVQCPLGHKVGYTNEKNGVKGRIRLLHLTFGRPIRFIHAIAAADACKLETWIHHAYASCRIDINGHKEIFDLGEAAIQQLASMRSPHPVGGNIIHLESAPNAPIERTPIWKHIMGNDTGSER